MISTLNVVELPYFHLSSSKPAIRIGLIYADAYLLVFNAPYVGQISGGLREGMALYLQGVVLAIVDR